MRYATVDLQTTPTERLSRVRTPHFLLRHQLMQVLGPEDDLCIYLFFFLITLTTKPLTITSVTVWLQHARGRSQFTVGIFLIYQKIYKI
jgi:hypothetical protein